MRKSRAAVDGERIALVATAASGAAIDEEDELSTDVVSDCTFICRVCVASDWNVHVVVVATFIRIQ